jgi:hypothetical protein
MRCQVCLDSRVQAIDAALATGKSARSLAREFSLSDRAMQRHAVSHKPAPEPVASPASVDPLAELIEHLRQRALGGSDAAAREYRLALAAQTDQSAGAPEYDVLRDAGWLALRGLILGALDPKARKKVMDAIRAAETANPRT